MEAQEIAELRTMYIFTPAEGATWGLTYSLLEEKLRARDPDEFIRFDGDPDGPAHGSVMYFGITLDGEELEGIARLSPEGVAIQDCTAHLAVEFVRWLRTEVVPDGATITYNTEWGLESDLPDDIVPDVPRPRLVGVFVTHIEATGGLDLD